MTSKEIALGVMRSQGRADAQDIQTRSPDMDGTALYAEEQKIPDFQAAKAKTNMSTRKAGEKDGFVCRSTAGRVVRLIQTYDSDTYPAEPEELPAQWRFVWSKNPADALPFVELATSPYAIGDCCLNNAGEPRRSTIDNNTWSPDTNPEYWEDALTG